MSHNERNQLNFLGTDSKPLIDFSNILFQADEHSSSKDLSIAVSEAIAAQPSGTHPGQIDHVDRSDNLLAYLRPHTVSPSADLSKVDKYLSIHNNINENLVHPQTHHIEAPTIQEKYYNGTSASKVPIEVYCIYSEKEKKYYQAIEASVINVLASLDDLNCDISFFADEVVKNNHWSNVNHLLTSSLILPLVSLTFITSRILKNEQMEEAIRKHDNREIYIVPILVHPVSVLPRTIFRRLEIIPTDGRAISQHNRSNDAYDDIVKYLVRILQFLSFH